MLSSVLNSDRAIKVNIQIMRIFSKMREMLMANKDVLVQLEHIQKRLAEQDTQSQAYWSSSKIINLRRSSSRWFDVFPLSSMITQKHGIPKGVFLSLRELLKVCFYS